MKEPNSTIARALLADIQAGKPMEAVITSVAAYLVEERRLGDLSAIVRDVERQLLVRDGKLYVRATTARALGAEQVEEIKQLFLSHSTAKEVIISETIDRDVIGGVRCETADQQLDLTVRRQLQRLKSPLLTRI